MVPDHTGRNKWNSVTHEDDRRAIETKQISGEVVGGQRSSHDITCPGEC